MDTHERVHFDELYSCHLRALKLRGMSDATIDSYAHSTELTEQETIAAINQFTIISG